jgi:hypothetical protein
MAENYSKGILTTADTLDAIGLIQKIDFADGGEENTVKDKTGVTKVHEFYDNTTEVTATVTYDREKKASVPAKGSVVTVAAAPVDELNGKYKITSRKISEANTASVSFDFTLKRWIDGDLPAGAVATTEG